MADHGSNPPSESGAQQESEEAIIVASSPGFDMQSLGFGMLEIAPLEDKTTQNEVSVLVVMAHH